MQQLEVGSEMLSKHLARSAWVALEAVQAECALALSNEALGTLPVAQQRKTATVDNAMLWKAAEPLLPR